MKDTDAPQTGAIAAIERAQGDGALHADTFDLIEILQTEVSSGIRRARRVHDVIDDTRAKVESFVQQGSVDMLVDIDDNTGDFNTESRWKDTVLAFPCGLTFGFEMVVNRIEGIGTYVVGEIARHTLETRQTVDVMDQREASDNQGNEPHHPRSTLECNIARGRIDLVLEY